MKIKKAVIPVAGKGTRFLPASKEIPKEMIPILNKPMIHYAVEEAVSSGIEEIIFITSSGKESIENYFDRNIELEYFLEQNNKSDYRDLIYDIGTKIDIVTVRQKEQLGLGHAVNCAKSAVGNEPFAVILGDDIIRNNPPATQQLIDVFNREKSSVIGVMEVPEQETDKYGIVDGSYLDHDAKTLKMTKMIEKPKPADAPTRLATPGRYIFSPDIFDYLSEIPRGVGGEYQLTDAINMMAEKGTVHAHIYDGDRYDAGTLPGYFKATIDFALRDESMRDYALGVMKEYVEKYQK